MKNKFKILDTGNFYFPIIDEGKKFIIKETVDINIDKKDIGLVTSFNKVMNKFPSLKDDIDFKILANPIWKAIKKELTDKYKCCWVVPIRLYKLGNNYLCTVDVLKKVK